MDQCFAKGNEADHYYPFSDARDATNSTASLIIRNSRSLLIGKTD